MDGLDPSTSVSTRLNAVFLPLCAALVIAANYVPLCLLLRVRKIAACTLVIVLAVENTFTLVNAIIWPNNNTAEWWSGIGLCDVQVALKIPLNTLLASSSAYLSWDLARALDTDNPRLLETRRSRRRRLAIEVVFCFGIPVLQAALHYVIQAGRFAVVTIYGCSDYVDDSWPTPIIGSMWPPIFALINCYFAGKVFSANLIFHC
jgi:pheromone a factor receptor